MSTKQVSFFMRVEEFARMLAQLEKSLGLCVFEWRGGKEPELKQISAESLENSKHSWRLYLTDGVPKRLPSAKGLAPGQHGWVQVDRPIEKEKTLYIAECSSKSDWVDSDGVRRESRSAHELFAKIAKPLKKTLKKAVWAKNRVTGGVAKYANIHFSESIRQWVDCGGRLAQRGVDNIDFYLDEPPGD